MFHHILVPLDGSGFAEASLAYALALAKQFNGKITLLRIVPHPQVVLSEYTYESADLFLELRAGALVEAEAYLKAQQNALRQQGYDVYYRVVEGENVAEWILGVADGGDVDAIVMSTHGRSGIQRWVFGSVAEKVMRHARIPVLLIRPDGMESAPEMADAVVVELDAEEA